MMQRWLLLCILIYALVLVGLGMMQGALLAFAIPFVIYLGAVLLDPPEELQLHLTRRLSADRVGRGTPVIVTLSVTNAGAQPAEILLEDRIPQRLTVVEGNRSLLATLAPGATIELEHTLKGERGYYQFSGVQVTTSDRLGLFSRRTILSAPGQFVVVPEIIRLRRAQIRPRRTQVYSGVVPTRQGGPGVEFFGVREYRAGDPTRLINSRATARHPQALFVNEFEQERVADVGLILDARLQSDVRAHDQTLFEHLVEATAALADVFLQHGNRVGLLIYGNALNWTFPGYGKVQRERILRALARAEPGDLPVFERLDYIPTRLFPARSQLVLISPLLTHDLDMLISLRARGYHLLVMSPDPISFEQQGLGTDRAVALASRIARLERALLLRKCQQAGVPVVDWPVDRPFQQVAEAALSRAPLWARDVGEVR